MSNGRDPGEWNLEGDFAQIPAQFDAIEAEIEAGDLDRRNDAVSTWSVGQQLIHTVVTAISIPLAIRQILRGGGEETGEGITETGREILTSGIIPRGRGDAPDPSRREETPPAEEIVAALAKARKKWEVVAPQMDDLRSATNRMPHPAVGPLTAAEWVRFEAVHAAHHLKLVDDIRAD